MRLVSGGIQVVVPVPSFVLTRNTRRLWMFTLVLLGIAVLGFVGNLVADSPSRAAKQWADAMRAQNQSAVLERTCSSMQRQVWAQQLSAHVDLVVAALALNPGPGKKIVPGVWGDTFDQVEKEGAHARVKFYIFTRVETPIGKDAAQLTPGEVVSEYWNMTREGWGAKRWKWCGYGGLAK